MKMAPSTSVVGMFLGDSYNMIAHYYRASVYRMIVFNEFFLGSPCVIYFALSCPILYLSSSIYLILMEPMSIFMSIFKSHSESMNPLSILFMIFFTIP